MISYIIQKMGEIYQGKVLDFFFSATNKVEVELIRSLERIFLVKFESMQFSTPSS